MVVVLMSGLGKKQRSLYISVFCILYLYLYVRLSYPHPPIPKDRQLAQCLKCSNSATEDPETAHVQISRKKEGIAWGKKGVGEVILRCRIEHLRGSGQERRWVSAIGEDCVGDTDVAMMRFSALRPAIRGTM